VSTILKALRRVEEERPGSPPARRAMRGDFVAGADAAPPAPRRKSREPNWKLWGSLGAAVLLAGLVWWRLPRTESAPVAEAPSERTPPAARPPAPPAERLARSQPEAAPAPTAVPAAEPAPSAVPAEIAQQLPPLGETIEPAAAPVEPPPPTPPAQPAPVAAKPPPPAPAPQPVASAPEPAPAVAAAAPVKPAAAPAPKPAAAEPKPAAPPAPAQPVAAAPKPVPPPAPPSVLVERTSWHPTPERRIAWVKVDGLADTRELHEGDAVGTLVVKEIRPSSVLFQHGAEPLTRRVGER
jgi:hypothetical protein